MQLPIVPQKLERPVPSAHVIPRLRLYEMMQQWQEFRCVYVHGPAGCGKSVLVSSWLGRHLPQNSETSPASAWLSLDLGDQDPMYWLWYVAAALDRLQPKLMTQVLPLLLDGTMVPEHALGFVLATLQPETERPGLLVLDDYHRAASPGVDRLLSVLLERSPPWLHFVLISRQASVPALNRLVAAGHVREIDDSSLRFRRDELAAYLKSQGMADLPGHLLDLLLDRTEGWIAALQLAGLGVLRRSDPAGLFAGLRGDRGWLASYLVGEVLTQLPSEWQRFLLQTSILDRFNASLAEAVTQNRDTYQLLDSVLSANLFLVPLDGQGKWFRYHHLFQELLQHRLHTDLATEGMGLLHRRAAVWLMEAGEIDQALSHLLAIPDIDAAVELVAAQVRPALVRGDSHRAERWIARLPREAVLDSVPLLLDLCLLGALRDDPRTLDYVCRAEKTLTSTQGWTERNRAELLVHRAVGHFLQLDFAAMGDMACQAYGMVEHLDDFMVGTLHFVLMHYCIQGGNSAAGLAHGTQAADAYQRTDFDGGVISVRRETAAIAMFSGRSEVATRLFEELGYQIPDDRPIALRDLGAFHLLAARHYYWLNRLQQATNHQQVAAAIMQRVHDPGFTAEALCLGQLLHATAPALLPDGAAFNADDLAVHAEYYPAPLLYWVKLLMKRGKIAEAQTRAAERAVPTRPGMSAHDLATRIAALHAVTLGGHNLASVISEYQRALDEAGGEDRQFHRLLLLSLFTWHQLRLGRRKAAAPLLEEALELTKRSGYTRPILDLPELAPLLAKANHPAAPGLLQQMEQEIGCSRLEQLTAQELIVLQLLDRGYQYREIAAELVISMNTVRFHVRNVYVKLGVNRRLDALRLARRQGLLPEEGA